jgi:anti-sigma B factor antagonist
MAFECGRGNGAPETSPGRDVEPSAAAEDSCMGAPYQVNRADRRGVPVIELQGECDIAAAPAIKAAVVSAFAEGATSVVFDLEEVTFLDSSAMSTFLSARRRAAEAGGTVTLLTSAPSMLRLLKLLELDKIITLSSRAEWDRAGGA